MERSSIGIFLVSESQPLSPPRFAALTERLRLQRAQDGGKIQRWGNKRIPTVKKRVEEAFPKMMNCQVKVKDEKIKFGMEPTEATKRWKDIQPAGIHRIPPSNHPIHPNFVRRWRS